MREKRLTDDLDLLWSLGQHPDPGEFYMGASVEVVEFEQRLWVCVGVSYHPATPDRTPPAYCPGPSELILQEVVTREEYNLDGGWQFEDIADPITKINAWQRNHRSWHVGEYVATGRVLTLVWAGVPSVLR